MSYKEISSKRASDNRTAPKDVNVKEWDYICTFGNCDVYANGNRRHLVDIKTGNVVFEYIIGIHGTELSKNNKPQVVKRKRNDRL